MHIYNHYSGDNSRPLASVALHPSEDVIKGGLLEHSIKTFVLRNVKDTFGLNYLEYINLPVYVCDLLSEIGRSELAKKASVANDVQKELDNIQGQGGS